MAVTITEEIGHNDRGIRSGGTEWRHGMVDGEMGLYISAHIESHDSSRRKELSGVGLIPLIWPNTTIKTRKNVHILDLDKSGILYKSLSQSQAIMTARHESLGSEGIRYRVFPQSVNTLQERA